MTGFVGYDWGRGNEKHTGVDEDNVSLVFVINIKVSHAKFVLGASSRGAAARSFSRTTWCEVWDNRYFNDLEMIVYVSGDQQCKISR